MSEGATPSLIEGIEGAVELSTGDAHACVRLSSGRVRCWDEAVELSTVGGLEDAVELVGGSCARTAGGELRCWSLPEPTVDPRERKRLAREQARRDREVGIDRVPPVRRARARRPGERTRDISSAALRGLLQTATSTAGDDREFWLVDAEGRLRSLYVAGGRTVEVVRETRPARVVRERRFNLCWITDEGGVLCEGPLEGDLQIAGAVDLAVGRDHACAVTGTGEVACWGENFSGQLGDGSLERRSQPVAAVGIGDAVAVTVGRGHTCALRRGGAIACWGIGDGGELGDPEVVLGERTTPARVEGLAPSVEVLASGGYTCARSTEGRVTCWGTTRSHEAPRCIPTVGGGVECRELMGRGSGCGGRRVGHARTGAYPRTLANISEVRDLAAAEGTFCAAGGDSVTCWRGQRVCGRTDADLAEITRRFALDGAAEVALGRAHLCAATLDGEVYCAGDDRFGQLGGATPKASTLQKVSGLSGIVGLSAGYAHTCGLHRSGEVSCWGFNATGQVGAPASRVSAPTRVSSLRDAVELSSGLFHTCARRSSGEVVCWGENEYGALGDGSLVDRLTPTRVVGIEGATALMSSRWQTCARAEGGLVSCWGGRPLDAIAVAQPRPAGVVPGWAWRTSAAASPPGTASARSRAK